MENRACALRYLRDGYFGADSSIQPYPVLGPCHRGRVGFCVILPVERFLHCLKADREVKTSTSSPSDWLYAGIQDFPCDNWFHFYCVATWVRQRAHFCRRPCSSSDYAIHRQSILLGNYVKLSSRLALPAYPIVWSIPQRAVILCFGRLIGFCVAAQSSGDIYLTIGTTRT